MEQIGLNILKQQTNLYEKTAINITNLFSLQSKGIADMKKLLLILALLVGCNSTIKTARTITVKARGLDQIIKVFTPEETTAAINDLQLFKDSIQQRYLVPDTNFFQVVNGVLYLKDSIVLGNVTVRSLYVGVRPAPDTLRLPPDSIINQIP